MDRMSQSERSRVTRVEGTQVKVGGKFREGFELRSRDERRVNALKVEELMLPFRPFDESFRAVTRPSPLQVTP